ncbi:NAD(P)-dependent oxidoreductase [Alsobacter sp. SYSU M60028]|uniref:dihydrouracil dehydrogenase (NAD(+)) n=1 Tax=Alsobacter ponti TaxID=2962936 RepID=A0ABT1LGI2_9HYPH|nr:NAD(P)-dependent oxidoreductase [Alsobacter ponti]MCP8940606.1 NAD(P)-dependent oxidoreductase [Alsobacter ponti]
MSASRSTPGIAAGRLSTAEYAANFSDVHPPLDRHEARVESDRCYFCFDAPCQNACPTSIDIPLFIRQIATGNEIGAAETILSANVFGGMCARVCPTETLCEEACVREAAEGKPVKIGLLQRRATDALLEAGRQPFRRAAETGRRVAVVGGGPAGLACAHKLAELGHAVTVFEARDKLGGLNEFGIASYKTTGGFAQREVEFVLSIGGIAVETGARLGETITLEGLRRDFDAVFLGVGLAAVNRLDLAGEGTLAGVYDAVDWIAGLRQARSMASVPVGRRVVVIGGGMTAIDAAVQARRLGAEEVTVVYRRGEDAMKASLYERQLAQTNGVLIRTWAAPAGLHGDGGLVTGVAFERTAETGGRLAGTGETFTLGADMVLVAIGQALASTSLAGAPALKLAGGRIVVDGERRTSMPGVWAGGDCVAGGQDLTVTAVEDGKQAALSIDRALRGAMVA